MSLETALAAIRSVVVCCALIGCGVRVSLGALPNDNAGSDASTEGFDAETTADADSTGDAAISLDAGLVDDALNVDAAPEGSVDAAPE